MIRNPLQTGVGKDDIKFPVPAGQLRLGVAQEKIQMRIDGAGRFDHVFGSVDPEDRSIGIGFMQDFRAVSRAAADVKDGGRVCILDSVYQINGRLGSLCFEF